MKKISVPMLALAAVVVLGSGCASSDHGAYAPQNTTKNDLENREKFVLMDQSGFSGGFDGINVDACGNVYVTEYIKGDIWRITPDGAQVEKFVSLPSSWIPNLRWGHGMYGWETDILYVADRDQGRIFAVHAGIEGKKHVLAP